MSRRTVADFLSGFVLPMVAGGDLRVRHPIDLAELQAFDNDLAHASEALVAIDDARTEVLATLVVRPPALVLGGDELHLAAALHNVLFLIHPRSDSWLVTASALRRVGETAQHFANRGLTHDRTRILARHALLHNILDLTRHDVTVSWWTGKASFHGQSPPGRLVRWRGLRRVHQETTTADFEDLLTSPQVVPIIATLLRRSPLTQLLDAAGPGPALHWEDAAFILRDPELARAITFAALAPTDLHRMVAAPASFTAAFEQMLERKPEPADVRTVAAFLVHLNVLLAMDNGATGDKTRRSPLLATVLAADNAAHRPRGLTSFFALPQALADVDPRLSEPPGLRDDKALWERWQNHRAQVREGVGSAVIDTLAGRLARHLGSPRQIQAPAASAENPPA